MATGACRWFGVTMTTASMPSGRLAFGLGHLAIVGIGAVLGDADVGAGEPGVLGIGRKRAGHQLGVVVEPQAMRWTAPMKAPRPPPTMPTRRRRGPILSPVA